MSARKSELPPPKAATLVVPSAVSKWTKSPLKFGESSRLLPQRPIEQARDNRLRYDVMGMMLESLIKKRAAEIGFDIVGIAPVEAGDGLKFSREWVERGFSGEMRYLENPKRDDVRLVLPSAQSVICVGVIYNAPLPYSVEVGRQESGGDDKNNTELQARHSPPAGRAGAPAQRATNHCSNAWISRYAWGTDYHKTMRAKLEELRRALEDLAPGAETRVFVDTGPVVERAFARLSGIGWAGKNTCLINESKGSWFFLGVILTSLALEADAAAFDRCGTCTACIDACPTQALAQPYVMDASRCVAYFNIELKGSIPEEFRAAIGANVVGCDICQDVCPWNGKGRSQESGARSQEEDEQGKKKEGRRVAATATPEFQPLTVKLGQGAAAAETQNRNSEARSFSLFNPPLDSLASLTEDDFGRIFRQSPVKRVKYRGWLRNVCVAMGNSGNPAFLPRLKKFSEHADPVVREHAEWAIRQIQGADALAQAEHPSSSS